MAPTLKHAYSQFTAAERKSIPLLAKYMCRVCEKFKTPESYSKKELNTYTHKISIGVKLNEITSKLRCRGCAGDQVQELQCEGPCGLWKDLDAFSKAQRSRGAKWCQQCILWKEAAEPGVVTAPAPNGELAPDEDDEFGGDNQGGYYSGPEAGGDSDEEYISVPYQAMSTMSVAGDQTAWTDAKKKASENRIQGSSQAQTGLIPKNPWGSAYGSTVPGAESNDKTADLRSATITTESSASNPYEGLEGSEAGWSAVDARRRDPVTFTGYDCSGQRHVQQRVPSAAGELSFQYGGTSTHQVASTNAEAAAAPKRAEKWAKPAGTRRSAPRFPVARQPVNQEHLYGSDESCDEP